MFTRRLQSFVSETELNTVSFGGDDIPYGVVFAALSVLFHAYICVYMFIYVRVHSTWSSWNLRKISFFFFFHNMKCFLFFYYIIIWNSLLLDLKHNIRTFLKVIRLLLSVRRGQTLFTRRLQSLSTTTEVTFECPDYSGD